MAGTDTYTFAVAFAGAGLHSSLIALALLQRRPALRIAMVERDRTRPASSCGAFTPSTSMMATAGWSSRW